MADRRLWPALAIDAAGPVDAGALAERLTILLDEHAPALVEELDPTWTPPAGLWDPTAAPELERTPADLHWRVFFSSPEERDCAQAALAAAHPQLSVEPFDVPDENWAARSQALLQAVHAGAFVVAPPWDMPADVAGRRVIVIEPSMGFGTGHHPTTRLCLTLLSRLPALDGQTAMDLGTGSGVLAVAAAFCGASVLAIDVDPDAIASAEHSVATNEVNARVQVQLGDFRHVPLPPADLVIANLTGGMLISSASRIANLVRDGGSLLVSGFDVDEEDDVRAAYSELSAVWRRDEDRWVALVLHRTTI